MNTPPKIDAIPGATTSQPAPQESAQAVTRKDIADLHDRIDSLEDQVKNVGKTTRAEVKTIAREVAKSDPATVHEAIVRVKADGCTLVGPELRAFAIKSFPKVVRKPKPA
jgi:hypothetical protein